MLPDETNVVGGSAKSFRQTLRQRGQLASQRFRRDAWFHSRDQRSAESPGRNPLRPNLTGDPEQRTIVRKLELRTHHTDNRSHLAADLIRLADHGRIATEPGCPERIADDRHVTLVLGHW